VYKLVYLVYSLAKNFFGPNSFAKNFFAPNSLAKNFFGQINFLVQSVSPKKLVGAISFKLNNILIIILIIINKINNKIN